MATVITKHGSSVIEIDNGVGESVFYNWKQITIRPKGDFMHISQKGVSYANEDDNKIDFNDVTTPAGTTSGENLCEVVSALFVSVSPDVTISKGTTAQRNASSPTQGDQWYDTDLGKQFNYNGTVWIVSGELIQMTNKSGVTVNEGEVVKVETSTDSAIELNTSTTNIATIGVIYEGGANNAEITVAIAGEWNVKCNDIATIGRNELCEASVTAGVCDVFTSGGTGAFAVTKEEVVSNGSNVLVKSIIQPTERF